eukprot:TRINITY_DN1537_c2_g4_i1.p1 TRINITY_DN1537_c2_g4~~TRINITY_DN1537_c2_g4_i1.p1  ORF type:complete len:575 (+),score=211.85 TRINITY_DN1537_c2_g4_i1:76-1800(+)
MADQEDQANRRVGIKVSSRPTAETLRRAHEDNCISIRKNKRDQQLAKRRNISAVLRTAPSQQTTTDNSGEMQQAQDDNMPVFEDIPKMVGACLGSDTTLYLPATQQLRQLLSLENNPPIQEVINSGVIPRLVQFLNMMDKPKLQFEAAWALTNVASGNSTQTSLVIQHGALPILINLINSADLELCEQVVWALGNIAGDSAQFRDIVLRMGVMPPLLHLLAQTTLSLTVARNAAWTFSNLCRGKPPPDMAFIKPALPTLGQLLRNTDVDVLTDALWALSYLTDGGEDRNQFLIDANLCKPTVPLLEVDNVNLQIPALRSLGNIVTGSNAQTQAAIDAGILPVLARIMRSKKKCIRKESCWALSNIAAGTKEQVGLIIQNEMVPLLVHHMNSNDFDVKREACWAVCNAISGGSAEHVRYIVSQGCIAPMVALLTCSDNKLVTVILEAVETIFKVGAMLARTGENPYLSLFEEADGVSVLTQLQDHSAEHIYTKAVTIMEEYFQAVDDDDDDDEDGDEDVDDDDDDGEYGGSTEEDGDGDMDSSAPAQPPQAFNFGAPSSSPFPTGAGFSFPPSSN